MPVSTTTQQVSGQNLGIRLRTRPLSKSKFPYVLSTFASVEMADAVQEGGKSTRHDRPVDTIVRPTAAMSKYHATGNTGSGNVSVGAELVNL